MRLHAFRAGTIILVAAIALQGCVATTHQKITKLSDGEKRSTVVLMPVDVTLGHLTTGGAFEPQAEWTELGIKHVKTAVSEFLEKRNAGFVEYRTPTDDERRNLHDQIMKLHRVVGGSILLHQYQSPVQLPTKKGNFEWSMGPDVRDIAESDNADYALFVYVKDSYATEGRVAAILLAAVLFGAPVQGGQQLGFASLVELKTGDVVWFNALVRGEGDLREQAPATQSVELLLANFPK